MACEKSRSKSRRGDVEKTFVANPELMTERQRKLLEKRWQRKSKMDVPLVRTSKNQNISVSLDQFSTVCCIARFHSGP